MSELILPTGVVNEDTSHYDSVGHVVFRDYCFSDGSVVMTTLHDHPETGVPEPAIVAAVKDRNGNFELPLKELQEQQSDRILELMRRLKTLSGIR